VVRFERTAPGSQGRCSDQTELHPENENARSRRAFVREARTKLAATGEHTRNRAHPEDWIPGCGRCWSLVRVFMRENLAQLRDGVNKNLVFPRLST
jgi:hypothetical protein